MTHWEPIITSCTTNWSFIQAGIQWTNWKILTNSEKPTFPFFLCSNIGRWVDITFYHYLCGVLRLYYLEKKIALWQENSNRVEDSSAISSVAGGSPLLFSLSKNLDLRHASKMTRAWHDTTCKLFLEYSLSNLQQSIKDIKIYSMKV